MSTEIGASTTDVVLPWCEGTPHVLYSLIVGRPCRQCITDGGSLLVVTGNSKVRVFCTADNAGTCRVLVARTANASNSIFSEILPY